MKLQYFKGEQPNFGDELNTWLWPRLLPGFLDNDPSVVFIGIGSIIGSHYEAGATKIVFGSGYVETYHKLPNVHGGDWDIFFVRGPRTAHALGLPETLGIGDAAILLRALEIPFRRDPRYVGFMPHWQSIARGNWRRVCQLAGVRLIDSRSPVEQIILEILGCKVLIAEAMHGAIVADALRVPWVPALPIDRAHQKKWLDWADSLNLDLKQHLLRPSSLAEAQLVMENRPFLSSITSGLNRRPFSRLVKPFITYSAAHRLSKLVKEEAFLSGDRVIGRATEQMLEKVHQLEVKYGKRASYA